MPAVTETGPFAVDQGTKLLERLAFQVHSTLQSRTPNAVHDLRVAIRRLTQALTAFRPCLPRKEARKIRRRLKEVMGLAGDVRDCDIALRLLAKSDWPDRGSLQQGAQTRRKESERALNAALRLWVARKTSAKWRAALESSPSAKGFCYRPVPETAAKQLVGMAKDFFRSGDRAVEDRAPAAELHEFRIAAKRFRYTLELFAEVYGASAGERVERIKSAQTLLGDINDCRTARQLLAELGGGKRIDAALKRKQRRRAQAFREMWAKEFGGPAVAKEWIEGLGRPAEMPRRKPMARSAAAGHAEGFARGA